MTHDTPKRLYFCPGEVHPISYAVHLARLAAFDPNCFECPLRCQTGHLSAATIDRFRQFETRRPRKSLISEFGVRGVYRNELTRSGVSEYSAAFVDWLAGLQTPTTAGLKLVIGYQEHAAAPDLSVGVVAALRRCGVQIADLGLTTPPAVSFAIAQREADGGILVTGSGCDPSEIGLDFLLGSGRPLADVDALMHIERRRNLFPVRRYGAAGGYLTLFHRGVYEASLAPWFHALRPLRVVLASPLQLVRSCAERLFASLPCSLEVLTLPHRRRNLSNASDPDLFKLSQAVAGTNAHLGVLVDSDARACAFVDETATLVPVADWLTFLNHREPSPTPRAVTPEGRLWVTESHAVCDGFRTLSLMLSALSRSDEDFSSGWKRTSFCETGSNLRASDC